MGDESLANQTESSSELSERISGLSEAKRALLELRLKEKLGKVPGGHSIPRLANRDSAPASFAQQRLWLLDQLEPNNSAYNMTAAFRFKGSLNVGALERSLNEIFRRHEVMRTTFSLVDGQLVQRIAHESSLPVAAVDLSTLSLAQKEKEAENVVSEEAQKPFDLAKGPLVRATLVRMDHDDHIFLYVMHHIVSDGWSMGILYRELSKLYDAFSQGKAPALPDLPIQYADFSAWQRQWLRGEILEKQLAYWKQQLKEAAPMLELPTDRPRPVIQTFRGASQGCTLPVTVVTQLRTLSRHNKVTLFMTLLAGFKILLHRYTGQADVIVGSPIAGRNRAEIEALIGFFVNTLVLRTDVAGNPTFLELLNRVRITALNAYAHQDLPFEKLVEELHPERDLSRTPLFQVFFNMLGLDGQEFKLNGITAERLSRGVPESKFDMTMYVREKDDDVYLRLVYNADLFDQDRMSELLDQYVLLLSQIAENPEKEILSLSLLTSRAKKLLPEATRPLNSEWIGAVHSRFSEQAQRTPDRTALWSEEAVWTYGELESRSNRIANYLLANGTQRGDIVAIYGCRAPSLVCAVMGILKARAAFLILDPSYPGARLADYLRIAEPKGWISIQKAGTPPDDVHKIASRLPIRLELSDPPVEFRDSLMNASDSYPADGCGPDDLAYIAFTSGTRGKPKAIQGPHKPLSHFIKWHCKNFGLTENDRFSMLSGLSHDPLLRDIFTPLWLGATLCIPDIDRWSPRELGEWMNRQQVTAAHLTPAMAELLTEDREPATDAFPSLRFAFFGGDVLTRQHVTKISLLAPSATCVNFYGATETPQAMGYFVVPPATESATHEESFSAKEIIPVGYGIDDVQLLVLNACHKLAGIGEIGEIYIRTNYLSKGYLGDETLTREHFLRNPFTALPADQVYRTGDWGRFLPNGSLEFAGRHDQQVKIRGFRVELAEIDAVMEQHPDLRQVVTHVRKDRPGSKKLVAYVVSKVEPTPSASDLRTFLRTKLPEYMVPSAFVFLDKLPLTPNGKVDHRALPVPEEKRELEEALVAPRTEIEEVLAGIWTKVLDLEEVGIHDNFFDLGGHSLLATQIISRVRAAFHVEIPLRGFFQTPTVAGLAEAIGTNRQNEEDLRAPPLIRVPRNGNLLLSFSQQRLWFLSQFEPDSTAYNISRALRLNGPLNVEALQSALDTIVARHEVLRTTITSADGTPLQIIADNASIQLPTIDLSKCSAPQPQQEVNRLLLAESSRPFNLASDLMLRVTLVRLDEEEHVLFLVTHHIASDGWSSGLLLQELIALYKAFAMDGSASLAELPIQYADFATWQRQWLQGDVLKSQLSYWKRQLTGAPAVLELPTDRPRPPVQSFRGTRQSVRLSKELTEALKELSRGEEVTLFMTLLAAFKTLLFRYTRQDDILVGVPAANRTRPETEKLIGFFVNNLILRTDLSGNPTFQELLRRVRDVAFGAYAHQDVPFEKLVEELQPVRDLSHTPLFQVMFGFQNVRKHTIELPGLTLTPLPMESRTSRFDLFLSLVEDGESVRGSLEYNTDIFDSPTITRMLDHFRTLLESIVANSQQRIASVPILTDTERKQLIIDWNDTKKEYSQDKCIHELFEAQAHRCIDATAAVFEKKRLTYGELNGQANQLARYLQRLGVGREIVVGICMERSLEMVVAILGVLKAGGAYVPLDPSYPKNRLAFMLEDAGVSVLLTQRRLVDGLPKHGARTVCFDSEWEIIGRESEADLGSAAEPDNLAYIIYTSGSTGKPKGVQVLHRGVVNFLNSMRQRPGLTDHDTLVAVTTLSFDIAGLELYLPLLVGAQVVLVGSTVAADGARLAEALENSRATVMQATPSTWRLLKEVGWRPGKQFQMLCGGEALTGDLADYLLDKGGSLWNMYGPTETTIWSATHRVELNGSLIPVGRPIDNTQIYILDPHFNPVPIGVPGELYIGGVGITRGYRNRPDLTAGNFVPDPFTGDPGARLYRTGDRARFLSGGNIEFLGRIDYQVKIRGFRIELGEIETVLTEHPAIRQAIVTDKEFSGDRRLIGYVVPLDGNAPGITELRELLRTKLPEYMVPSGFVFLDKLPLTPNGKVDRRALPAPDQNGPDSDDGFAAPRDAVELQLAQVWKEVLGIHSIDVRDNFFDLGGHSLLAVRLFAQIEKLCGKKLPLALLFQAPTIQQLAALLRQKEWFPSWSSLVAIQPNGSKPPFFCVHAHRGNVLNFNDLARNLGTDQPFYGLQAQGLDGQQPQHTRIEDMAAHYLREIRTVQPAGPYFLGGYCFGGNIALEMAQQLCAQGEHIALLAMIDSYAPGGLKRLPWIERRVKQRFSYHWGNIKHLGPRKTFSYALVKAKVLQLRVETKIKKIISILFVRTGIPLPAALRQFQPRKRLRDPYVPRTYAGKITVFSPTEGPKSYYHDSHMGWGRFTNRGVEVYEIPGSFSKIILEPAVKQLAERLTACINNAIANDNHS